MKSNRWLEWKHLVQKENKSPVVMVWVEAVLGLRCLQRHNDLLDSQRYDHLVWRACWFDVGVRLVFIVASRRWLLLVYLVQEFGIRALIPSGSKLDLLIIIVASLVNGFVISLYVFPLLVVVLFGESLSTGIACAVAAGLQWLFPTWTYMILHLVLTVSVWLASVYFKADWIHCVRLAYPLTLMATQPYA